MPYRRLLGEAVEIERDVTERAASAPKQVQRRLSDLAPRIRRLVERALPRARHGTDLTGYLLRLDKDEPQYQQTAQAIKDIERELTEFVAVLKGLRGKVYNILADASRLSLDQGLERPQIALQTVLSEGVAHRATQEEDRCPLAHEQVPSGVVGHSLVVVVNAEHLLVRVSPEEHVGESLGFELQQQRWVVRGVHEHHTVTGALEDQALKGASLSGAKPDNVIMEVKLWGRFWFCS